MRRALALARRGSGSVKPNPMVGAVVVKDGEIVGCGWHKRAGGEHAEIEALTMAGPRAAGASLYTNLEPCNHYGKTPPCTEIIIKSGISRVFVAMRDPNPHVKGNGVERLREAHIEVDVGLLAQEARELNLTWIYSVTRTRPYLAVKLAMSLDGKLAYKTGASKWISSQVARTQVQRMRRHVDALLVGCGTVIRDNPYLTNRTGRGKQPLRVIVDSTLRVHPGANVFVPLGMGEEGPNPCVLVATTTRSSYEKRRDLELAGAEVVVLDGSDGRVDLEALLDLLGERNIQGVLCEGGAQLVTSLIDARLCDRLMLYQAPIIIGSAGVSFYEAGEFHLGQDAPALDLVWCRRVGPDLLAVYDFRW